ncbi:Werner Syndrome-like exonuclease isoform X3 [Ananas comosus]|nr:Werner Syndrome-like exonuclease isoform X3 [Ananas comosus]
MGSEAGDAFGEWGPAAEEELRAIEAACGATPTSSPPNSRRRRRRLPSAWSPQLSPHPCTLETRLPAMKFGGQIVYCRTASEVEGATAELLDQIGASKNTGHVSLGFDIEWRPVFRRGESPRKAAVMQICMDNTRCYVMHIFHSGIPPILKSLLEDNSSVKVGIAIANDARKISNDYNVCVRPVEDLSGLANLKLGGPPRKWSLCSLTEMVTCKKLEKPSKIRMGNWEADILSREKLEYAATDAFASWYLYEVLKGFPDANAETDEAAKANGIS